MTSLIYIADPMCSWCYGFGPELSALMAGLPEIPVEVVVGGLRLSPEKPMDASQREKLRGHWQSVHAATGLPFADQLLQKEDFWYDTVPACRAVVAARLLAPDAGLAVFQAIQQAFYGEGRDVTQPSVLAEVAARALTLAGVATDAASSHDKWADPETIAVTQSEFLQVKRWGVDGFPTLVLDRRGQLDLVTAGFVQMPMLVEKLEAIIEHDKS